jgi:hypothetical protein
MNLETMFTIILDTEDEDFSDMLHEITVSLEQANLAYFHVEVAGISWQKHGGKFLATSDEVCEVMTDWKGDFRLTVVGDTAHPTEFHGTRYSHDEPHGATFEIRGATPDEIASVNE